MFINIARVSGVVLGMIVLWVGVGAAQSWKDDFERICGQTNDSESLSKEQLQTLVKESDELRKRLDQVNDPGKKVYVPRLEKCRNFFAFMAEKKGSADASK